MKWYVPLLAVCLVASGSGCTALGGDGPNGARVAVLTVDNYGDGPRDVSVAVYRNSTLVEQWTATVPAEGDGAGPGPPKGSRHFLENTTRPGRYRIVVEVGSMRETVEFGRDCRYLVRVGFDSDRVSASTFRTDCGSGR